MTTHITRDPLDLLRDADPVGRYDLSEIDPAAHAQLRAAIPITARREPSQPSRRWPRITAAGAVALALTGATYGVFGQRMGEIEGTDCHADGGILHIPASTGDPVLDCVNEWRRAGITPPQDLTAFREKSGATGVAARSQLPAGATPVDPKGSQDPTLIELDSALRDIVDGPEGTCTSGSAAAAYARRELDRLGQSQWTVTRDDNATCAYLTIGPDPDTVTVRGSNAREQDTSSDTRRTGRLAQTLRHQISQGCLSTAATKEAVHKAMADNGFAANAYRITTLQAHDDARCPRIDITAGGILAVRIYTPAD
ncbi:hypothetical protein ACQP1U_14930 [Actinomycetota bacterium]